MSTAGMNATYGAGAEFYSSRSAPRPQLGVDDEAMPTGSPQSDPTPSPDAAADEPYGLAFSRSIGLSACRPFMVRNLKNVNKHRSMFNVCWAPRGDNDPRRCFIRVSVHQFLLLKKFLPNTSRVADPAALNSFCIGIAIRLCFEDVSGRATSFTSDYREIQVSVVESLGNDDLTQQSFQQRQPLAHNTAPPVHFSMDLTSILVFLRRFPKRLSLRLVSAHPQVTAMEQTDNQWPGKALSADFPLFDLDLIKSTSVRVGVRASPVVLNQKHLDALVNVQNLENPAAHMPSRVLSREMPDTLPVGRAVVDIQGGLEWMKDLNPADSNIPLDAQNVQVALSYSSEEIPWWYGISRHDFVCPWCHLATKRLRSLIVHLQTDHIKPRYIMDGPPMEPSGRTGTQVTRQNMMLDIRVLKVPSRFDNLSGLVHADRPLEGLFQNISPRSSDARMNATGSHSSGSAIGKHQIVWKTPDHYDSSSDMVDDVTPTCLYCGREFDPTPDTPNNSCCGEWCLMLYGNRKLVEQSVGKSAADMPPLRTYARPDRGRTINFQMALGEHSPYHVVSVAPFLESHFDERDPDSEEEVDHSWRLTMQEEDINALPVSPKHKVLWTMWNRHVFRNGPAGGYGYQFTRNEIEKFAIEMRDDIRRLGLRVHFLAFLRALHIHGHIDAEAILSAFQCLDRRKKRRACRTSRYPKPVSAEMRRLLREM